MLEFSKTWEYLNVRLYFILCGKRETLRTRDKRIMASSDVAVCQVDKE